ncbi:MAG: hypothetical protein J2P23_09180 [Microlunatus sp.]|nr:hypothetical protein [Microlunatus sp.]
MAVRSIMKKAVVAGASVALAGGITAATADTASATSWNGCGWPRVCFYKYSSNWYSGQPSAAYQDVTSGYQTLGSRSYGAYGVYNSRNDDVAYLHYTSGRVYCLKPNHNVSGNAAGWGKVDKIRISWSSTC